MTIARQISWTSFTFLCGVAALLVLESASNVRADEPLPTEEVVSELVELTAAITPFTVQYDAKLKALLFSEIVESRDKALTGRVGELQARLDRMDIKRMNYQPSTAAFAVTIRGKPLAGRMTFYCREGEKCIRRGLREETTPDLIGEESAEDSFSLDVVGEDVVIDRLLRFAALVRHLITISSGE